MRGTIIRIGVTGAGALLALGLFAAQPAGADGSGGNGHGSDTSCFTATGHTQGRSHSDPDGMSNGGADKPGCPAGTLGDQDGNNGCGNDADREDDNNGNCGRKGEQQEGVAGTAPSSTSTTTTTTTTTTTRPALVAAGGTNATGTLASASASASGESGGVTTDVSADSAGADNPAGTTVGAPQTLVLGQTIERPSALVRTGAGIGGMALLGGLLCGSGRLAVLARRLLRIG